MEENTLYYGDCLDWMRRWPSGRVDLIYLDPPFNSNADYNILFGTSDGIPAQLRAFGDTWSWNEAAQDRLDRIAGAVAHPAHQAVVGLRGVLGPSGMLAYLTYMAERLVVMRALLKPSGTLVLHCSPTASHYLKALLDGIMGSRNFASEIVWNYGTPSGGRAGGRKPVKTHETLLVYAREYGKHTYNRLHTPYSEKYVKDWFRHEDEDGRFYRTRTRNGNIVRQYLDESPGMPLSDVWSDIMQLYGQRGWFPTANKEDLGYPTQKPIALLRRVLEMASNEGDLVLDPFCGCGTTVAAARELKRRWIGIDISSFAIDLVKRRRLRDAAIPTRGIPTDMASARELHRASPLDFEAWAVSRIPGLAPNDRRTGDRGIDGRGSVLKDILPPGESRLVLAQVKGGRFGVSQFRDFLHVLDAEKAAFGVYITMDPVNSAQARQRAVEAGSLTVGAQSYPRVQFFSIADLFAERRRMPLLPPMADPYTGKRMQADLFA